MALCKKGFCDGDAWEEMATSATACDEDFHEKFENDYRKPDIINLLGEAATFEERFGVGWAGHEVFVEHFGRG